MAGDAKGKVPDEVLAGVDWEEVYVRLTAFAHARLRGGSLEEARRMAREALRVLLDDASTVEWDHQNEPDPIRCLGSIVNGLVRNHFRKKSRIFEVVSDDVHAEPGAAIKYTPPDQEARTIAADMKQKVLTRVLDLSDGDDLVQELVMLAEEGVLDAGDQAEHLKLPRPRIYEARRRFKERVDVARRELEGP